MAKKKAAEEEPSAFAELDDLISKTFDDIQDASKIDTDVSNWYSWGNYALNYICTKNIFKGVPAGRITSVKGLSSTGKSLLLAGVAKDPKVDMVIAIESEGSGFTKELFAFAGGDIKKLRLLKCSTFDNYKINKSNGKIEDVPDEKMPQKLDTDQYLYVEGAIRKVKRLVHSIEFSANSKANIILIVDSLANLQSAREKSGVSDMGKKTQLLNIFFRTFDNSFEKTNISFMFTNKLYTRFGDQYNPWVENGGEGAMYNPSLSLLLTKYADSDEITDGDMKEEKEKRKTALGSTFKVIQAKVDKSRFGTEMRNIFFIIDFATGGILPYSGLFKLCIDFGIMERKGSSYTLDGVIDGSFFKKDFAAKLAALGEAGLVKLQEALEKAETRIRNEHIGIQTKVDLENINEIDEIISEEDDDVSGRELASAMREDL